MKEHTDVDDVVNAIFKFKVDAMTPAWRRMDNDSYEKGRIRPVQVKHIVKVIISVRHTPFNHTF